MNNMTDCEIACKNAERALAAEIAKEIYRWKTEGKSAEQIINALIEQLPKYQS